mgnify:CR=1 FL=1
MPTRTRLLLAKDLDPVPRCEFLTAGSGAASGCLLLANTDHHTNLFVLDCATLKLRQVPGLSDMETPFPRAHGMACGTVAGEDRPFLAEGRYDHVKWGKLKGTSHEPFVVERGGSFGDEGSAEMTEPNKLCLSRGELWIVRGGDNHEPFITVVQAATGTKTGHIPASDLGAPVSGPPGLHVRGLALSNEEAFVVTGTEAKVAAKAAGVQPFGVYTAFDGYRHLAAGLTCGLSGLAAGMAIGIVGDSGVRAVGQQPAGGASGTGEGRRGVIRLDATNFTRVAMETPLLLVAFTVRWCARCPHVTSQLQRAARLQARMQLGHVMKSAL